MAAGFKHFVKSTLEACSLFKNNIVWHYPCFDRTGQCLEKKNSPRDMKKIGTALKKMQMRTNK